MRKMMGMGLVALCFWLAIANVWGVVEQVDFRQAQWGMSKDQVKAVERGKLQKEDIAELTFQGECYGEPCRVVYSFRYKKLTKGEIFFTRADQDLEFLSKIAGAFREETGIRFFARLPELDAKGTRFFQTYSNERTQYTMDFNPKAAEKVRIEYMTMLLELY